MKIERLEFDNNLWSNFVLQDEKSNIFSSPEMNLAFNISDGFESYPLFAMCDNKIVAAAFPVLVKIKTPLFHRLTNRVILYSSPVFLKNETGIEGLNLLLEEIIKLVKNEAVFIEIRNSEDLHYVKQNDKMKDFIYIPYQNYILDLRKGMQSIWNSFSSDTRNHLRKYEKKGLTVREINDDELDKVVYLIEKLYKRKRIPLLNKSIFYNTYNLLKPKGYIRITVCEKNLNIIAARITLNYNKTTYFWYSASDPLYNKYFPNEVIMWETIQWACNNGFEIYDFGGGAVKGQVYGPAKFKEKFRGELVEFGRYRYIINKPIYFLGSKIYNLRVSKN